MAISRVNSNAQVVWSATSATTYAAAALAVTTGNTLVVAVGWATNGPIVTSVTDTAGNAFLRVATVKGADNYSEEFWVAANVTGHAADVVTVTWSAATTFRGLLVAQYAGVDTVTPYDASATGTVAAGSATVTTGTLTTHASGEVHLLLPRWGLLAAITYPAGFAEVSADPHAVMGEGFPGGAPYVGTYSVTHATTSFAKIAVAIALYPAGAAPLALTIAQRTPVIQTAGATSTVTVLVFGTPPTLGDAIVVAATGNHATTLVTTCTDNWGNTYGLAHAQGHGSVARGVAIWYCPAITATGASFTVTVTGADVLRMGRAFAVSGVGVGLLVDQVAAGATATVGTTTTGATPALTAAESLLIAAMASNVAAPPTVAPEWTVEATSASGTQTAQVNRRGLPFATGRTPSATWTWSGAGSAVCAIVAFAPGAPITVTVPDVVGETEAAADALLVAAGLVTGTVTTASSETVPAGEVISQSPASGASVAPGSAVDLVISTGPAGPPVYVIGIGEIEVVPLLATFRIQETIDAPDTMIADVFSLAAPPALPAYQARILADGASAYWPLDDPSGTTARDLVGADDPVPFVRFSLGQPVVVTEDGVRIFGGVVTGTRERGLTGPSATDLVVEIQATSYELSAARRVITAAISQDGAETIGAALATLVTDYYAEVDVTLHPDQVAGPALPAATFTRSRGDAVNKHLASSVGYLQSIDFENRLRAWAPGDILAPANYDEATNPELLTGDITVERQLQNGYANRVILTGDPIPVPGHVDHFTGDGTTDTWPVTYVVNGPYPYFVDGAVAQGVIQYPATSTTEAIGGVEAPVGFQWEYDPIALTIHRRLGPVAAGVAFDFPYDGLFIPAGMAEDAGEIADLGLWEHVENVTAVITDVSAQGYADALLAAKIASKDEIVRLQTRALGFHPGQTMTIASFSRLLAGDYLITQVDTGSESGGILLVRSITASKSQNNTHDWRRVYQQWAGASAAQNP